MLLTLTNFTSCFSVFIADLRNLLLNKICSIAQILRLLHILLEVGCKLNVRKFYNSSF